MLETPISDRPEGGMTREDYDFFMDNDCSVGEHFLTRLSYHDTVVEYANHFANGELEYLDVHESSAFR